MLIVSLAVLAFAAWFMTGRHLARSDGAQVWWKRLWIYVAMGVALVVAVRVLADSPEGFAFVAVSTGFVVIVHASIGLVKGAAKGIKSRNVMRFVQSFGRGLGNVFLWLVVFMMNSSGLEDGDASASIPASQGSAGIERELAAAPTPSQALVRDEPPVSSGLSASTPGEAKSTMIDPSEAVSSPDESSSAGLGLGEVGSPASTVPQPEGVQMTGEEYESPPVAEVTEGVARGREAEVVELEDEDSEPLAEVDGIEGAVESFNYEVVEIEMESAQDSSGVEASEPVPRPDDVDAAAESHDAQAARASELVGVDEAVSVEASGVLPELEAAVVDQASLEETTHADEAVIVPEVPPTVEFTIVSEPIAAEILVRSATTSLRSVGRGEAVVTWPVGEKLFYKIRPTSASGYLQFDGEVVVNETATHPVWLTPAPVAAAPNPSSYPLDSPERTVVEWFAAYARKDWNTMTNMRLRSQRDWETAYNWIEGTYFFRDFKRLISVDVRSQNDVSARVRATWEHSRGRSYVDLVLIREDSSGNPWPYAPWGVSYTSATGVRDAN